jgi:hypothetical protein
MQDLSEIHLLPEELEEYSRFSRIMKLLKKLRLKSKSEADDANKAHKEVRMMQRATSEGLRAVTVAPSSTGLKAAPIASEPEPINQIAMPKPVNSKLEPLSTEKEKMSTRVAAAHPNNPFERMMLRKFAALADDGTPSLEEAAGIGLFGLGGAALGNRLAPLGSKWMAEEALGEVLGPNMKHIKDTLANPNLGYFGQQGYAMDRLREAARLRGLRAPEAVLPIFGGHNRILGRADLLQQEMAEKLTKGKRMPLKALGALAGILGGASIIKSLTGGGSDYGSMPAEGQALGAYPEAQMTDMGGQYPGAY